jgi:adenosylmethionine-8-amino-7-oxononanoate aminotransferase
MPILPRQEALLKRTFIDYQATSEFLKRPVIFHRAEGLYLWDIDEKRYFDAIGGIFVATLGHRHPRVMEAMRRQMDTMTFSPPLHGVADVALDFIEKVGLVAPPGMTYVKPFCGGSEAVEAAMKFVRQYFKQTGRPGKYKFISRYQSYHGGTFGAMSAGGAGSRKSKFEP